MIELKLYDRIGNELAFGDIVKVSDGKRFNFYAEVKWLPEEKVITPFHTFSFHSFEKVDKVPDGAVESKEERYKIWYFPFDKAEEDNTPEIAERYLTDWRCCEHLLEKRCYRIEVTQ